VRNIGPNFQINDQEQADALPTRVDVGVQYQVPRIDSLVAGGELVVTADVVATQSFGQPSYRAGAEFTYKKQIFLRAGYATGEGDGTGGAFGIGFRRGGIAIDFSRCFTGPSSDAGTPATFITLRFQF
jgi:hypothetical protein